MASLTELEQVLYSHKHTGSDFTQPLNNLDMQVVGKVVLATASTNFSIAFAPKQFLRIIVQWGAKSGSSDDYLRFNGDSGSNYTTTTGTSQAQIDLRNGANSALGAFSIIEVSNNLSSLVKPAFIHTVNRITSAGTAISSFALFASWVNTSAFLTSVSLTSSGVATYPAGSSITVFTTKE
jgi:hypothetical protein